MKHKMAKHYFYDVGKNSTSKEFRKIRTAKIAAQKYANKKNKSTALQVLRTYRGQFMSQGTIKTIRPKR